jgi:hypothetical protein
MITHCTEVACVCRVLRPCSEDVGDMGKGSEQGSPRACVEFDGLLDLLKRCGLGGRLLVAARRENNSTNGGSQYEVRQSSTRRGEVLRRNVPRVRCTCG